MSSEADILLRMRDRLRAALPPCAFLRRDRGEYLFVSNAPAFADDLPTISGFFFDRRGPLLTILPDESWARELEDCHDAPDHLAASLRRFRGERIDRDALLLLAQGFKIADMGSSASESDIFAYDRALRRRAALALRGACCGGGLYAAALLRPSTPTERIIMNHK